MKGEPVSSMNAMAEVNGKEAMVDDLVQVMVPRRFLVDVYALIAKLQAEEEPNVEPQDAPEPEGWTPEVLRRFYEASATNMVRALNHLAKNPDQWIPGPDLSEAIDPEGEGRALPGTFSGASRHAENRYGLDLLRAYPNKGNPFLLNKEWGHVEGRPHTAAYRLDGRYAEQIQSYMREV